MNVRTVLALVLVLGVVFICPARSAAQVYTGRIDVQVQDSSGGMLPGATVELTGVMAQSAVTDSLGQAHFLNLPVGDYKVTAHLQGFADYASPTLPVQAGGAVPLKVSLAVAGVSEKVEVTGEAPLIDTKKQTTGMTMTQEELQELPSARSWSAVAQSVPTISTDRVNVGGSESGAQANLFAKGASNLQNSVNLDGVVVTDGGYPTVLANPDFDTFSEIQMTTGGASTANPSAGIQVNLIMKSGSNIPHGSARYFFENDSLQSNNLTPDLQTQLDTTRGNRIDHYHDYGFELGGPLLKDKVWAWGGASNLNLENITLNGYPDATTSSTVALKATWQATPWLRPSFTYYRGRYDKPEQGVGPDNPPEVALHVTVPTNLYKGEANIVAGKDLFITGRVAYLNATQDYTPAGGLGPDVYRDADGVWHNGYWYGTSTRPQTSVAADASYFKGHHELKFGFSWRKTPIDSTSAISSANSIWSIDLPNYATTGEMLAFVKQPWDSNTDGRFFGLYAGDTITLKRATITAALRWDHSAASILQTSVPGVPGFEQYLPAKTAPAIPDALVYSVPSPRVGISYQLDSKGKTQVRASYAMLASLLKTRDVRMLSAITYSGVYYLAIDQNHDGAAQANEILYGLGPLGMYGFNPSNPAEVSQSVNRIDSNLKSPYTHEVVFGIDHELMPDLSVSASFTYRRFVNQDWTPLIGVRSPDYVYDGSFSGTLFGQSYSIPNYSLPSDLLPPGSGKELVTRDGYYQVYEGLELSAVKRLSHHWMGRLGFSTNTNREYFTDPATALQDPTPDPASPNMNGGQLVYATQQAQASAGLTYIVQPKYQFIANGLYQLPWGLDLAGNLLVRQGYALPYYLGDVGGFVRGNFPPFKNVLVTSSVDEYRLPAVVDADFRVQKSITLHARAKAILSLDVFNFLNEATVLNRQEQVNLPTFNNVLQVMSPRIARLGVRFTF